MVEPLFPHFATFPINLKKLAGTQPVVIRVAFEDANGYPFTSMAVNQLRSSNAPQTPLRVALKNATIQGQGSVEAKIFNGADRVIVANYRLLIPRELISTNDVGTIEVGPKSKQTFNLQR